MDAFGIHFLGITSANGRKLLATFALLIAGVLLGRLLSFFSQIIFSGKRWERVEFWIRQGIRILITLGLLLAFLSIWFDDPARLATAAGLISAGIAFGLQRVITALAAYFVLLRGKTFGIGDRITMGGVRGDVVALDFIQTTIMEMGEPPGEQDDAPSMWVHSRQYTGRLVTVTNDKIFDLPVYNYSREFPYVWDEMHFLLSSRDDRVRAEQILMEVANKHTDLIIRRSEETFEKLKERYLMRPSDLHPRVYLSLNGESVELSLRFLAEEAGVRELKDGMNRDILQQFEQAKISFSGK